MVTYILISYYFPIRHTVLTIQCGRKIENSLQKCDKLRSAVSLCATLLSVNINL
jgi:hypothetical protein